ncbi:MAG TPA: hypothetical protein VEC06_06210 [Paucimonas sp.]|nr:hypothetical protein [Paucimonas sp.]
MDLHQIQLSYQVEEDRLLFRVSFKDGQGGLQEIRSWLTRRFVRNFWPGVLQTMEKQVALAQPAAAHASAELVGMGHEASVSEIREAGGFDAPFEAAADSFPLGDAPLLITAAHLAIDADRPLRIDFVSPGRGSFEVAFTATMLHGFCTLLQEAVKKADWDIELVLPGMAAGGAGPRVLN